MSDTTTGTTSPLSMEDASTLKFIAELQDRIASIEADNARLNGLLGELQEKAQEKGSLYGESATAFVIDLKNKLNEPAFFGCFTGDCPHETQAQCNEATKDYIAERINEGDDREQRLSDAEGLREQNAALVDACEALNAVITNCEQGHHNYLDIYTHHKGASDIVIRWCVECGCIIGDEDFDGRTNAGAYMTIVGHRLRQMFLKSAVGLKTATMRRKEPKC